MSEFAQLSPFMCDAAHLEVGLHAFFAADSMAGGWLRLRHNDCF
jgi:hypothetical protein